MKKLDRILQNWRYRVVEPYIPNGCRILDIGGFDGSFLRRIYHKIEKGVCIDPLIEENSEGRLEFLKARVMDKLPFSDSSFDVITMLAVYEHLGHFRNSITSEICRVLRNHGLIILTVPSSAVDYIINILIKIKVIDGMSYEEHSHFKSSDIVKIFAKFDFKLKQWSRFQLGLNNLFIFEKL